MSDGAVAPAFLSVRLPEATRARLKAVAAARGESVQSLVGDLVKRFLVEQDGAPPDLAFALTALRGQEPLLRNRGVSGLWVFGSVARGEARPDSDIDLFADFAPGKPMSLLRLSSLRVELSEKLGCVVDLVERNALRTEIREAAERDAVRVL